MSGKYRSNRIHEIVADPQGLNDSVIPQAIQSMQQSVTSGFTMYKAVVLEVFFDPKIIDDKKENAIIFSKGKNKAGRSRRQIKKTAHIRELPRNSILAQIINDGSTTANEPEYLLPFFPSHLMLPVKPGEHVWIFREENKQVDYGFWFCRISEPRFIEDTNYTHANRKLDQSLQPGTRDLDSGAARNIKPGFNNGAVVRTEDGFAAAGETATLPGGEDSYIELLKDTDAAKITDFEPVPRFTKRPADLALQGSNNTLIVMGTDRTGPAANYEDSEEGRVAAGKPGKDQSKLADTIDSVVGRGTSKSKTKAPETTNVLENKETDKKLLDENDVEGDPNFAEDSARIYLSMKTGADDNFNVNTTGIPKSSTSNLPSSAAVIKADNVRVIARKELRLLVQPSADSDASECASVVIKENGDIVFVPSAKGVIKLGGDDADLAVLGSNAGTVNAGGTVTAPGIITTMGGVAGIGGAHGVWAKKVLIK